MDKKQEHGRAADLLQQATNRFKQAGIDTPRLDAEVLLAFVLSRTRTQMYLNLGDRIDPDQARNYLQLIERRSRREPIGYITGLCEFWSRPFQVDSAVLIPRPETEVLVELVLARSNFFSISDARQHYLDLCCGSGIIAVTIALECGQHFHKMVASDISAEALTVCRRNCISHGVDHKIMLVQADLATGMADNPTFTLITANPPYVSRTEMAAGLQQEVIGFEPLLALDGGEEGLDHIRAIIGALPGLLAPGGDFFMEIGADQAIAVRQIFAAPNTLGLFDSIEVFSDYAGRDRVVHARRKT